MLIPGSVAKKMVALLGSFGAIPVGGYARDSHQESYHDLDFLAFKDPRSLLKDFAAFAGPGVIRTVKAGPKYVAFDFGDYRVDIWKTTPVGFYRSYVRRTLAAPKQIWLAKTLRAAKAA